MLLIVVLVIFHLKLLWVATRSDHLQARYKQMCCSSVHSVVGCINSFARSYVATWWSIGVLVGTN